MNLKYHIHARVTKWSPSSPIIRVKIFRSELHTRENRNQNRLLALETWQDSAFQKLLGTK